MKYKGLRLKVTSLNSNFNIKILLEQLPALSGTETCSLKYFSIKLPLWWRTSDNRRRPSNSIRLSFTLTTLASRLMTRSVWLRATLIQKHSHTRWCRVLFLEVLSEEKSQIIGTRMRRAPIDLMLLHNRVYKWKRFRLFSSARKEQLFGTARRINFDPLVSQLVLDHTLYSVSLIYHLSGVSLSIFAWSDQQINKITIG